MSSMIFWELFWELFSADHGPPKFLQFFTVNDGDEQATFFAVRLRDDSGVLCPDCFISIEFLHDLQRGSWRPVEVEDGNNYVVTCADLYGRVGNGQFNLAQSIFQERFMNHTYHFLRILA